MYILEHCCLNSLRFFEYSIRIVVLGYITTLYETIRIISFNSKLLSNIFAIKDQLTNVFNSVQDTSLYLRAISRCNIKPRVGTWHHLIPNSYFFVNFTRTISLLDDIINSEPCNQILETFSLILYIETKFFTLKHNFLHRNQVLHIKIVINFDNNTLILKPFYT